MVRVNKRIILLKEVLGITKSSAMILDFLIKKYNGKTYYTIKDFEKQFDKDRTTIQKNIYQLLLTKVIKSKQVNLDRGFRYEYILNNKSDLQDFLKDKVNERCDNDIALINRF